ncbi:MAG: M20/M25/M40 family metallo-hydrolase [Oscillospiraceae bacterium]|nr:M20/M25/M40 family metallo-hydrolase [Oscillospiraceae bacterium]
MKNEKDKLSIERFQSILKIKTISGKEEFKSEFDRFYPTLRELYPTVFEAVEWEVVGDYGILIRWKGKSAEKKPVIFMAHQDVVACEEDKWTHPPFAAEIHEGMIWARGSVDTKCIISALMESAEELIDTGFVPERDIYFAFGADEEVFGTTMPQIVETLQNRGIEPWFVLDEGGAIISELPMGISEAFAMVAVTEKAYGTMKIKLYNGDKANAPQRISEAVKLLADKPLPGVLDAPVQEMLRRLGPYATKALRPVMKNIRLFAPAVNKVLDGNSDTRPMIRSSIIHEKSEAYPAENAAGASFKLRLNPWDNGEKVRSHVQSLLGDDVEISIEMKSGGAPVSSWDTDAFRYIEKTVAEVFSAHTTPFVLDGGTDARHAAPICKEIYRLGAFRMSTAMRKSVHHENERMPVENYLEGIRFYKEFIKGL